MGFVYTYHSNTSPHLDFHENSWAFKVSSLLVKLGTKIYSFAKTWGGRLGIIIVVVIILPFTPLLYLLTTLSISRLKRSLHARQKELELAIDSQDMQFEDLIKLESVLTYLSKDISKLKTRKFNTRLNKNIEEVISIFNSLKEKCVNRHTFLKDDIFETQEEFDEYNKSLESLNDIWNYETSNQSKKVVFDIKNSESK